MTKYKKFPSLRLYDQLGVPYVLHDSAWKGPLWTGHCMMLDLTDGYGDEGFFHELSHWIEATPRQRRYPDLAMGRQINCDTTSKFGTSTSPHLHWPERGDDRQFVDRYRNDGWGEVTVPVPTAHRQEGRACSAMFFYFAATGLTGWTDPHPLIPTAACDFAGSVQETPDETTKNSMKTIRAFDPAVTPAAARGFIERMNRWTPDQRTTRQP